MRTDYNYYLLIFCKTIIFTLATFLTPIQGLLILTGMSVLLDTVFAIYTTIKLNGWRSYQSTKLFNIVVKTFFYFGSIILGFIIDTYVIENNTLFGVKLLTAKVVSVFWLYIEVKSIDETSQKLGNKSFYFIIKNLLIKLKALKQDINEIKKD